MTAVAERPRARAEAQAVPVAAAALERVFAPSLRFADDAMVRIALPAPCAAPAALLQPGVDGVLWESRDGHEAWAGVGAAVTLRAEGADRFAAIAAQAAAVEARLVTVGEPTPTRWIGGFGFAVGGSHGARWAGFGDACFTVPRWSYERTGDRAAVILTAPARALADRATLHAELAAIISRLGAPLALPEAERLAQHDLARPRWTETIAAAKAAIASGALRKVVAARARVVELARALDPAAVIAELGRRHPTCTRFAIARGGTTFVGASPERLLRKRGRVLDSEALAGSCARGADDDAAAAALLASAKDRGEHAWVVEAIERALAPRCAALTVPAVPSVRALRNIVHLHTPITGQLTADHHILELIAALHPTPAVGGTPTPDAVAWIAGHEPTPRGWYAAPVGWFDSAGDGEFAVAIRSGLLAGATATLFAGAGIVSASDADAEWAETELKFSALAGALGMDGAP